MINLEGNPTQEDPASDERKGRKMRTAAGCYYRKSHADLLLFEARLTIMSALLLFSAGLSSPAISRPVAKLVVEAGGHTRVDTPVSVSLDNILQSGHDVEFQLEEIKDPECIEVPSQFEPSSPGRLWWILSGTTPAGATRTYQLSVKEAGDDVDFRQARENGELANEGFKRCHRFVEGWLKHADPKTGLIPKGLKEDRRDFWNPQDAGADNYPFMVLTAAITDRPLFEGRMLDILRTETRLTSRIGAMPDAYSFSKQGFRDEAVNLGAIIFGSSEYVKDGLLPLTEWLGESPWSERMTAVVDAIWENASVDTPFGKIVSESHEINGEMLQALSRIYWMTGEKKYLEWAVRLGDYYLLDKHHPTRNETKLRLRDHGCEVISGLCELYATVHFAMPEKKQAYQEPIHEMLDRILEVGRNEHGLFYNTINPQTGEHDERAADTWGYDLNGFYTVYLIDNTESYRQAVLKALGSLNDHYRNYRWEGNYSADGFADSIESAINLYNREPVFSAAEWIDSETRIMWSKQQPDGVIEGWHGDGNFARTTIMYSLWKTAGITIRPWREDVVFGAVQAGDALKVTLLAEKPWKGEILFDAPRHKTNMKMPLDWPRINQFPEWFVGKDGKSYLVRNITSGSRQMRTGYQLREGVHIELAPNKESHIVLTKSSCVGIIDDEGVLEIQCKGRPVMQYNHIPVSPPEGVGPLYTRSGFIHPLWSPTGEILTDIHPPDHVHHMGIWMPWTKTEFEARQVDFWNLGAGKGTVRFKEFVSQTSGPVYGGFEARQEHVDLTAPGGEKVALNENLDVRVYNVGGPRKGYWLWDFISTQRCATGSPLQQHKYRYGGLGFRANRNWKGPHGDYLTSEGKTRKDANKTRARWCDVYGEAADKWSGATVFSSTRNFRHPEPMRIWGGENDYVFLGFAPSQLGDWVMEPGKDYVFRYRFYVHDGKPVVADIERLWNDYAEPSEINVQQLKD